MANLKFVRYQLPAIVWALAIFVSSSIPADKLPELVIFKVDKLTHFVVFFLFAVLIHRAAKFQNRFPSLSHHSLMVTVVVTILYGVVDEVHQSFVPNRDSSVMDLIADAVGATLYATAVWLREKLRRTPKPSRG